MSTESLLTIGIPTYNRVDAVEARVRELLEYSNELGFRILVIDNASDDGTTERLTSAFAGMAVDLRRNAKNLGYAGNVLRLIELADTEYLMIVSDEDTVERPGLMSLMSLLRTRRPRLVSPRAQVGTNTSYRGRRSTRLIRPAEFESASFYVSGLTMQLEGAQRDAADISALIPANAAASYYPQVLLTALAIVDGESLFLDALVTRQVTQLPTRISNPGPGAYWLVPGRWAQFEGFEEFFRAAEERFPNAVRAIHEMRASQRSGLMALIESAAVTQYPGLTGKLEASVQSRLRSGLARLIRRG